MNISQCLIAKNEEKNIGKCLGHLKNIVDEQIVIDTGSTDKTIEIAKSMGAKVYEFGWINDFSAAKNFAISKAKGDWIIFLDCDEYFTEESVAVIKKCIKECKHRKDIDGMLTEMTNVDSCGDVMSIVSSVSARIFRNKPYIQYLGKIHERIANLEKPKSKNFNLIVLNKKNELKIIHTGYARETVIEKGKSERNVALLRAEILENPNIPELYNYLGESLLLADSVELHEDAIQAFDKAIELMQSVTPYLQGLKQCSYRNILNVMMSERYDIEKFKEIFDQAVSYDPEFPDFYYVMSYKAMQCKRTDEAEENSIKCIDKCNRFDKEYECKAMGDIVGMYKNLLQIYMTKDNRVKAVEISIALLKTDRYDYKTLSILMEVLAKQEKVEDIIRFLAKIYDYNLLRDKMYLIKASENLGNLLMTEFYKDLMNSEEKDIIANSDILKELLDKNI